MSDEPDRTPYLVTHPPARSQFRTQRRAKVTGAIVVHTFENEADLNPPDTKAETGAAFIARRPDKPGSYHTVVDSDSAVQLGWYRWEMFGEGTGGNRWALHLSFACKAAQWATLPDWWINGAIEQAAIEAARMARWVKAEVGVTIPAKRITAAQYRAGEPGFVAHGDLDPSRRTDPGKRFFWGLMLERYDHYQGVSPMPPYPTEEIESLQTRLEAAGYDIGASGVDGILGPKTMGAFSKAMDDLELIPMPPDPILAEKAGLLDSFASATSRIENGEEALRDARARIRSLYEL